MNADTGNSAETEQTAHVRLSCFLTLPPEVDAATVDEAMTVRLSIQDVTMLDESSTVVAETVVHAHDVSEMTGPFDLEADLQPGRQYAVYAHLDSTGDGTVASGDLVSTTRIPVTPDAAQEVRVDIPVQAVD